MSTFAAALLSLFALGMSGCSSAPARAPVPETGTHRTIAEGYSLLYAIASQQKDLKKLLAVKIESDPVDALITELAEYMGELSAELEDLASRYPALTIEREFLPEVEIKARESIASETTKVLLSTTGKEFERYLLLKQRSALDAEAHVARVMVELETAGERGAFWKRTEKRLTSLRTKVDRLLERDYFCT